MNPTLVRRLIFLIMLVAITMALLFNIEIINKPTSSTTQLFALIDTLPPGSFVMLSFDFEASSFAEVRPLAVVCIEHAFRKNLRVIGLALFAEGTALGEKLLSDIANEHGKSYGNDFVYLGYRPQFAAAILSMGRSITAEFSTDYFGKSTERMPILADVTNYDQISLVISIADGSMPTYWTEYAVAPYGADFAVALAGSMATAYYPYLESGQIKGLVAGLKGAAEYESLLGVDGGGSRGILALSVGQMVILFLIVAGNISEHRRKRG